MKKKKLTFGLLGGGKSYGKRAAMQEWRSNYIARELERTGRIPKIVTIGPNDKKVIDAKFSVVVDELHRLGTKGGE